MADEMFPTVLVRWEGNNSKRYDNTKKEIFVSNIVAINKTAVIEPSLNQISVGDHIEYEFVAKKGKVQLWHGVVVSTDPDAERRTGSVSNEPETTSKRARCRHKVTWGNFGNGVTSGILSSDDYNSSLLPAIQ